MFRRLRYHAWGIALVPLAPILLPLLGLRVGYETWARQLGWPVPRRKGRWTRLWWWYGYHGLYQIDWRRKHRRNLRTWPPPQCVHSEFAVALTEDGEIVGGWSGWRCRRVQLHRGPHVPLRVR